MAKELGLSQSSVSRVWRHFGLQPHRLRRYMVSDDPEFEEKAADILGLYLKPPLNAAVFCLDEKSAIKALDRLKPVLTLSPERHGFEYFRHGTLSLYAAPDTRTGDVLGKTAARHTSAEFVGFLGQIVASQPQRREIHLIADNLSAHKTKQVFEFGQSRGSPPLHSDLSELAPSSGNLIFQNPKRCYRARNFHFDQRPFHKADPLHPPVQKTATPFRWRYKNADYRIKPITQRTSDSLH